MLRKCTRCIFLFLFVVLAFSSISNQTMTKEILEDYTTPKESILSTSTGAGGVQDIEKTSVGFYIEKYTIDIDVAENNVLHITEVIDCDFYLSKHGIYRDIPLVNEVEREDGTKNTYRAQITNIKVNNEYSKSREANNIRLQIGSADSFVKGKQSYTISYDYNLGKDHIKEYDELYFNLIGLEWQTSIEEVVFSITMPKSFDSSLVGFTSGYKGSLGNNVEFFVEGNTITGKTISRLSSGQALTIRLQLPENYFVGEGNIVDFYLVIAFVVPITILVAAIIAYFVARNVNKGVQTVEFYPPENLDSLEMALIYKGKVTNKDVISLLVSLAHKGYLKIEEKDDLAKSIDIIKVKDYDGKSKNEKELMDCLFSIGRSDKVSIDEMKNLKFGTHIERISKIKNAQESKGQYFKSISTKVGIALFFLSIVALVSPGLVIGDMMLLIYLFPIIGILLGRSQLLTYGFKSSIPIIIFMLFWGGIPFLAVSWFLFQYGIVFAIANFIGLISMITTLILKEKINFRTYRGGELYAKILGFRHFIKTAEKSRLEMLCNEQPSYFYNILPYAYVLGVSDVWIKRFESIAVPQPDWYTSQTEAVFRIDFCTRVMTKATKATMPVRTGSSGGGFGGGGSSGGGSGGGGGGSW